MSGYHQALWVIYRIAANTALLVASTNWDYVEFNVDDLTVTTQILANIEHCFYFIRDSSWNCSRPFMSRNLSNAFQCCLRDV